MENFIKHVFRNLEDSFAGMTLQDEFYDCPEYHREASMVFPNRPNLKY